MLQLNNLEDIGQGQRSLHVTQFLMLVIPPHLVHFNEVESGVYWFHLVRLSLCPSVDRIVSALYLQQYLPDPFHIHTSYQATSGGVLHVTFVSKYLNLNFWQILLICNFDFDMFWLGIQYESVAWVIIRRQGIFSERRHSSCSNYHLCQIWKEFIQNCSLRNCLLDQWPRPAKTASVRQNNCLWWS